MGHEKHLEEMNNTAKSWLVRKLIVGLLCICSFTATFGQNATVSGVVKDDTGEPVIGAGVLVKGTTSGTITDVEGHFSFRADDLNGTLVVSFVGMETQEIPMKGKGSFNVVLKSSNTLLDEVQVVAYGAQKKITLTGSISSVNTDELLKVPTASIGNMLSGVLSGVSSVQSSGQPGGDDPDVFIRGISTLNATNAKPLYLVDGVERSFFQIDPNEIENITILKDASSTAVFGVRGANGVIIVTTKRGKEGKAKINASFSYGIQAPTRMPEFVNSYDYATFLNEAYTNDGKDPKFTPESVEAFRTHSNPILYPDTDWMDLLFKSSAPQTQGNVNISGGTGRVRYFISMGMLNQKGFFKNHDTRYDANFNYNRYNYRANLDVDFTKTTLVAINLGGRVEKRNFPRSGDDMNQLFRRIYWATPFSGPGIVDGKWIKGNSQYLPVGLSDGLGNIYGRGFGSKATNVVNLDLALTQKLDFITKGLQFKIKIAYNSSFDHTKDRGTSIESYQPWYRKDVTWMEHPEGSDPNEIVYIQDGEAGLIGYGESFGKARDWYAEASFDWKRDFGKHHLAALALYNQSKAYYPESDYPGIPRGYVGLVGRVTYDYDNKYLIEGNVGYNGSENFAPGNRYGLFPAVSGGWVLSQEEFLKDNPVINFLKIRGSYGIVGNDRYHPYNNNFMDRFLYLPNSYFIGGGYQFGTGTSWSPGAYEKSFGNSGLSWEKSAKQNYGIDFSLFGQKLSGSIDYFYERRTDILAKASTDPAIHAMSLPVLNLGIVSNKGVELNLKWNHKMEKIRYWANLNLSYAKNKIVYQDEVPSEYEYTLKTGHPVGQPFGLIVRGLYYEGMENVADHSYVLKAGDVVYKDLNEDGKIDDNDKMAIGYPSYPLLNAGLTLGFEYKGFDFSMLWVGATKTSRVLQETFRKPLGDTDDRSLMLHQFTDRWTPETAATAKLPRPTIDGTKNNYRDSDLWVKDASYLRLKNIEIGYNFRLPFMPKIGMETMRVFMTGYNLLTLDKLKISDPESMSSGVPQYPVMRVINFGLNVSF
ncbi:MULTISPECIES: SusC/RagA family TonB-linked outer membrane protein [Bacteroides]|uniref:SusC/RagA family TonB-linked outer membrane protein n=1 Tax=Bacteroides TaxID=816 RepID=UPI001C37753E|nr:MULTISPECIES: TonB-dependent receptor [Bacteroides]MBV3635771.1 TonB-dependent receptor [Bacteroides cellulosilyticus]MBV3661102.1 TonB-dependent receptor [Bacteroides cellulosilyticus]MBV3683224.1 TonB-dependent receptor [Bacteroides cellulosilyticus]MBV3692794.1 TonB-dependent receptor [Bacteroides cellulosilyticus]MBV3705536.1 TonB-dependent receptor [Bacteroides cellulosilyticus]